MSGQKEKLDIICWMNKYKTKNIAIKLKVDFTLMETEVFDVIQYLFLQNFGSFLVAETRQQTILLQ